MTEHKIKAVEFYKMADPTGKLDSYKYVCYLQAANIPQELQDWMFTNPREQNTKSKVAAEIRTSLAESNDFHELNRGLVLLAQDVDYDTIAQVVTIRMEDPLIHGDLDGGHTLRIILEQLEKGNLSPDRYVQAEIFVGSDAVRLAKARNTSAQLDTKSIAELEGQFETLKTCAAGATIPFADRVSYKMNQYREDDFSVIDAKELVAILLMFNHDIFKIDISDHRAQPTKCLNDKEGMLQTYIQRRKEGYDAIEMVMPISDAIFKLWDAIERDFPHLYGKTYRNNNASKYKEGKTVGKALFSQAELQYRVPRPYLYPILSAFRALVQVNPESGLHTWKKDPIKAWTELGKSFAATMKKDKSAAKAFGNYPGNWHWLMMSVLTYDMQNNQTE